MLTFEITYHANGYASEKFIVPAQERGAIGCYHKGVPYGPDIESVIARVPYHIRKAVERSIGFWQTDLCDIQRMDLNRKKDFESMGCLFAKALFETVGQKGN